MGCFSAPSVKNQSTADPYMGRHVIAPFARFAGQELFGADRGEKDIFGQGGIFQQPTADWVYPGQRIAPPTSLQQGAFDWAGGIPGQTQTMQNFGMDMLGQAPNFGATKDYTARLWEEDIAPQVMETFAGMGTSDSGGAQQALQRGGERVALGMAAQMAPMELQARLGAASALPAMQNMGLEGMRYMGTMGAEQRGLQNEALSVPMSQFYESQPWNHPLMSMVMPSISAAQGQLYQQPGGMGYSALTGMAPAVGTALTGGVAGLEMFGGAGFGKGALQALGGMSRPY